MILVDANILLYAYDSSSPEHAKARTWWERRLSLPEPILLAWVTLLAFIRIGTNSRALRTPMTIEEACGHVASWLDRPMVRFAEPTEQHWAVLSRLLIDEHASANLVTDAHLAALAMEHGATLASSDRDFKRFPGLRWEDPLRS